MKLEQQVVSLELAKRLKELGVKQDSLHEWIYHWRNGKEYHWSLYPTDEDDKVNERASAFTVAELGEMLPKGFRSGRAGNGGAGQYKAYNSHNCTNTSNMQWNADTEADVRAKMLVYLLEN